MTGVRTGQPRLRLRVTAPAAQPIATSLTLTLPRGVLVTPRHIRVVLPDWRRVDTVVIGLGARGVSPSLRTALGRHGRAHPLRRRLTVTLTTQASARIKRTITVTVR